MNHTSDNPATDEGPAEFTSVVFTFDHLLNRVDGHVVQKMVFSTQDETESLLALLGYYKEGYLTAQRKTLGIIGEAHNAEYPIFVYVTPRGTVEAIMSVETMDVLAEHRDAGGGSVLGLTDFLTKTIAAMHNQLIADVPAGKARITPLLLLAPELSEVSDQADVQDQALGQAYDGFSQGDLGERGD